MKYKIWAPEARYCSLWYVFVIVNKNKKIFYELKCVRIPSSLRNKHENEKNTKVSIPTEKKYDSEYP